MDRDSLARFLELGLSLEQIAHRVGRDPSTVGYWVKKHGLQAVHRDRHASRGGLTRDQLEALDNTGETIESMARKLGRSEATVRYWLKRHGLQTRRSSRRAAANGAKTAGLATPPMHCGRHGLTEFWLEGRGYYRCRKCRKEAVVRRRRKVKEMLIAEAGGKCQVCGYDRYSGALQFHHLDPSKKSFGLSMRGVTRSISRLRAEAEKCVLLCSNCHAEVEGGVSALP